MIPKYQGVSDVKLETFKNRTYRIDFKNKRIVGMIDGNEAVTQAVRKLVKTERYSERIYSGDYGIELLRLIGASIPFVESNLELTLSDAFMPDDRIREIRNIKIERIDCDGIAATFDVSTVLGELKAEVTIGG